MLLIYVYVSGFISLVSIIVANMHEIVRETFYVEQYNNVFLGGIVHSKIRWILYGEEEDEILLFLNIGGRKYLKSWIATTSLYSKWKYTFDLVL